MNRASVSRYFEPFFALKVTKLCWYKIWASPSKKVQNLGGLFKEKQESTFVHFFLNCQNSIGPLECLRH